MSTWQLTCAANTTAGNSSGHAPASDDADAATAWHIYDTHKAHGKIIKKQDSEATVYIIFTGLSYHIMHIRTYTSYVCVHENNVVTGDVLSKKYRRRQLLTNSIATTRGSLWLSILIVTRAGCIFETVNCVHCIVQWWQAGKSQPNPTEPNTTQPDWVQQNYFPVVGHWASVCVCQNGFSGKILSKGGTRKIGYASGNEPEIYSFTGVGNQSLASRI